MKILLMLYVLTFGPVIWLASSTGLSADAAQSIYRVYGPLIDCTLKKNDPTGKCLMWWACLGHEDAWFTVWAIRPHVGHGRHLGVDD